MTADVDHAPHYSALEDAQGLLVASAEAALGIHLLRAAGLMTGGTAGFALILSYAAGWSFGLTFFLINIPFYLFAFRARGMAFFLKSLAAVTLVSVMAEALGPVLQIADIHPAVAAALFGVSAGVGLLGLFRHSGSLGGVSIVAVVLQDRYGIRAGLTQIIHDSVLFAAAFLVLPVDRVLWSLLGALVLNLVIAFNHRRDWYVVT